METLFYSLITDIIIFMIDAHCHLNFPKYENDLSEVIEKAKKEGVKKIINVGTSIESSKKAVELSREYDNLYAIVGVHPHGAYNLDSQWEKELEILIKQPKVVGIGEIGLDYFAHNDVDPKVQKKVFEKQIEIAVKNKMPIQIHSRKAAEDILDILSNFKSEFSNPPGMLHCMAGNLDYLKKILDLGFYIGFDGNITYKGLAPGEETPLRDLVEYTPLDRIITETDAPWLTPEPHRGSRNEPSYVIITAESIANTKGVSFDEVNNITTKNAELVFKI